MIRPRLPPAVLRCSFFNTRRISSSSSSSSWISSSSSSNSSNNSCSRGFRCLRTSNLATCRFFHSSKPPSSNDNLISFVFVEEDGKETPVKVPEGCTVLEAAHSNNVPIEGACEGQCSCSTCHVILSDELFAALKTPTEEEEDMLDLAACLTDTSRLGCQIRVNSSFNGEKIRLPPMTRNFFVDGYKPSPH